MENLKEKLGGGKPTYQQEQAKLRSEEREKEDKKLRKKKYIRDRKTRQKQEFNEKIANLPTKIKEVHLDGITVTKDVLVKNILSDLLQVNYLKNSLNVKEYFSRFKNILLTQILFFASLIKANTYGELLSSMRNTHSKLKKLGCFKRVDGFIDSSKDDSGMENVLLILFLCNTIS